MFYKRTKFYQLSKYLLEIVLLLMVTMNTSQAAPLDVVVTSGVNSAIPIAVVPFKNQNLLSEDITQVIRDDLDRTGLYSSINLSMLPQQPSSSSEVDPKAWSKIGVSYLVIGAVTKSGSGYKIDYQLVDIAKQQLNKNGVVLNNNTTAPSDQLRQYAHGISNSVYHGLTGNKGPFLTRLAYVSVVNGDSEPYRLYVSDYDGSNPHILLKSKEPLMSPAWSPTGDKLAYVSFENKKAEIFIMNVYSGAKEAVPSFPRHNGAPNFSPDGSKLVVTLSKTGQSHLYVYSLGSKQFDQITMGDSNNTEAIWKDNQTLIFTSDRGGKPQIYETEINQKQPKRISWQGDQNLGPQITPDGQFLIMVNQTNGTYKIAKQNLKTGYTEVLTQTVLDESPTISPDGSMIIYCSKNGFGSMLDIVSLNGQYKNSIPISTGAAKAPSWSPYLSK